MGRWGFAKRKHFFIPGRFSTGLLLAGRDFARGNVHLGSVFDSPGARKRAPGSRNRRKPLPKINVRSSSSSSACCCARVGRGSSAASSMPRARGPPRGAWRRRQQQAQQQRHKQPPPIHLRSPSSHFGCSWPSLVALRVTSQPAVLVSVVRLADHDRVLLRGKGEKDKRGGCQVLPATLEDRGAGVVDLLGLPGPPEASGGQDPGRH